MLFPCPGAMVNGHSNRELRPLWDENPDHVPGKSPRLRKVVAENERNLERMV